MELLAVVVILAVILVIAVSKVMSIIEDSKKATLESTAKMIASAAEKVKVQNIVLGNTDEITCESVAKINEVDYKICRIEFDEKNAKVTLIGSGKFDGLNICNGSKTSSIVSNKGCGVPYGVGVTYIKDLLADEETLQNGLTQTTVTVNNQLVNAGIRYTGSNPSNKVYFNCEAKDKNNVSYGETGYLYNESCEIWRIIGVFDVKSSESETEKTAQRIKIVRDALDTLIAWDTIDSDGGYVNQWGETTLVNSEKYPGPSLMQYLNGDTEGNYYSLSSIAKSQISDALWNIGALEYVAEITPEQAYHEEKGEETGFGETINYTAKWVGKIGLIYPSNYGYAGEGCTNVRVKDCGKQNWMNIDKYYWLLSPCALNGIDSWVINTEGRVTYSNVYNNQLVRPTLYLSSNVKIIGGNGNTEPFKLK